MKHLVSFDTAKELRDSGYTSFDYRDVYDEKTGTLQEEDLSLSQGKLGAPKISDVIEWLYDEYGLIVQSVWFGKNRFMDFTVKTRGKTLPPWHHQYTSAKSKTDYYESLDEGIRRALKVIKEEIC